MKKISKLEIKNFQSHKNTVINFSNFTGIVGETNAGKSAALRALKWALYNTPAGSEFIRKNSPGAAVTVCFDDGSSIKRLRTADGVTPQRNEYTLIFSDGASELLEHFGSGPVDQVMDFHGMRMIDLFGEKESLNLCGQLDAPFFLSKSPQLKAGLIGQLSGVATYDVANKNITSDVRAQKKEIRELRKELSECDNLLKDYAGLDAKFLNMNTASELLAKTTAENGFLEHIQEIHSKLTESEKNIEAICSVLDSRDSFTQTQIIHEQLSILVDRYTKARAISLTLGSELAELAGINAFISDSLISDIRRAQEIIPDVEKSIQRLRQSNQTEFKLKTSLDQLVSVSSVLKYSDTARESGALQDCIEQSQNHLQEITSVHRKILYSEQKLAHSIKEIVENNSQKSEYITAYKNILIESSICPTCFSQISQTEAQNVVHSLESEIY